MLRLEDVGTILVYNQNLFNQVSMMEEKKKRAEMIVSYSHTGI